jgi:uncharacterized membrane protein YsdA (DUF1294 family)
VQPRGVHPYIFFGLYGLGVSVVGAVAGFLYFGLTIPRAALVGINLGAFVVVGLDKWLAHDGALRAPERVIIALAVLGGSLGVFLALHTFRHKTRKPGFQAIVLLILCAQVLVATTILVATNI